jgi:branched-chain amino acid transport system ATP-binding protein
MPDEAPALHVEGLHAGYGNMIVVHGVTLTLPWNSVATVIGLNGAGKTTLVRAISGVIRPSAGRIEFDGADLSRRHASDTARRGIITVYEGRQVFSDLTVRENLVLGYRAMGRRSGDSQDAVLDPIYELLPRLRERNNQVAGTLSGGEQQMLALGRALACRPRLLVLDEPSTGLAPVVVGEIYAALERLRSSHLAMLLIEQDVERALALSDYAYVLTSGVITAEGPSATIAQGADVADLLFAM